MTCDVIATGSGGNAVVLGGRCMVDCGVPFCKLGPFLLDLGVVFLTHRHGDHFKKNTVQRLAKERPTLRWSMGEHMLPLADGSIPARCIDILEPGQEYGYKLPDGTLLVRPFRLRHDVPNFRNRLYKSDNRHNIGQPCALDSLAKYALLQDDYTYSVPMGLGMVQMKTPIENLVDGSTDGVSVYSAAVGLIHNIDHNEAQINGEFDRGESRIIASSDLMERDDDGKRHFADHIFVGIDDSPERVGVTIFSPELRDQSFLNRKREYLRNVESIIGIKRGLLSEVEAQERTAKEVTSSEGDYNLTIIDLQEVWTQAVKDAVKLCSILGRLYHVPGATEVPEDDIVIDWGNGVLFDEEKTWADYLDLVSRGMLKPEIALGWKFGMPTETEADLAAIRAKYMPELQQLTAGEE